MLMRNKKKKGTCNRPNHYLSMNQEIRHEITGGKQKTKKETDEGTNLD